MTPRTLAEGGGLLPTNPVASGSGRPQNSRGGEPVINVTNVVEGAGDQPAQEAGQNVKTKNEKGRRLAH